MISYGRLTPAPSLMIIAILSIIFLCFFDVFVLINYYGFVSCLMIFGKSGQIINCISGIYVRV